MFKLALFCLSLQLISVTIVPKTLFTLIEICDNGMDDDNDGLIDINDPDCICNGISDSVYISTSIIPNASFEEYTMCPFWYDGMPFCKGWIQASDATSDYFNTCGFKGESEIGYPPQPLPSGNGYVGFIDMRRKENGIYVVYKEYVGSCLRSPLLAGKEYTLSLWIGFGSPGPVIKARDTFNLGLFATDSCKNLPFKNPLKALTAQCPTSDKGWYSVKTFDVPGKNEWKKVVLKIKPVKNIAAIIIGPACGMTDGEYYCWMDELLLDESIKFEPLSIQTKANLCSEDTVTLTASKSFLTTFVYQWYKNGIAIIGAKSSIYNIPSGTSGEYVVKVSYGTECELSKPFIYKSSELKTKIDTSICNASSVQIASKFYSNAGIYFDTLMNQSGCDSILEINVKTYPKYVQTIKVERCENTAFEFDGRTFDSTGVYTFNYSTLNGCDSTVIIDLTLRKKDYNKIAFEICNGDYIKIANKTYDQSGLYLDTLYNVLGCDSVLEISILQREVHYVNIDSTICAGSFVGVGSNRYTASGLYTDTLKTSYFCDSVIHLNLIVNNVNTTILDSNICEGDFVEIFGMNYYTSGTYTFIGQNQYSCDSIVNLKLKTHANDTTKIDTAICYGSYIEVLNQRYSSTSNTALHTMNQYNCDSSIFLNVLVNPVYHYNKKEVICDGSWINIGNQNYDKTGTYTISLNSSTNCDSIIQLELITNPNSTFKLDTTICYQQQLQYGNKIFTQTGKYHFLDKNQFDCDSITDIQLVVNSEMFSLDSIRQLNCENDQNGEIIPIIKGGQAPYMFHWNTGSNADILNGLSSGNYTLNITDQNHCSLIKNFVIDQVPCFCFDIKTRDGSCLDGGLGSVHIQQQSGRSPMEYFLNGKPYPVVGNDIQQLKPGSYLLEIVDEKNCNYSHSFNLELDDNFVQDLGTDTLFQMVGDSVELLVDLPSHLTYQNGLWKGSSSIACPNCINTKTIAKLGYSEFNYSGEDVNGCQFVYKLIVVVKQGFFVPNIFSPNDDETNDYFNLISDASVESIDLLQIYNRWGERIYESKSGIPNTSLGAWDGTLHGEKVNPGVFIYLIQFKDKTKTKHQLTGEVTLIR